MAVGSDIAEAAGEVLEARIIPAMSSVLSSKRQRRVLKVFLAESRQEIELLIQAHREKSMSDPEWCERVATGTRSIDERLSTIIAAMNERFDLNLGEELNDFLRGVSDDLATTETIRLGAQANDKADLAYIFNQALSDTIADHHADKTDFVNLFFEDGELRDFLTERLLDEVYSRIRGARPWPVKRNLLPRFLARQEAELEQVVCEGSKPGPHLRGLVKKDGDSYTRTKRSARWSVTAGLNLKVDGEEVASGPVAGLCALGRYLHQLDYPAVGNELRKAFGLDEPFDHDVDAMPVSEVTQAIVADFLAEGLSWETAGKYLGVGSNHWDEVRAQQTPSNSARAGRLGAKALRILASGAHPRVVAWILGLSQPHGPSMASELLERLKTLGLAKRRTGDEWVATQDGRALIRTRGGPIDPLKFWALAHPNSEELVESLAQSLRLAAESAGAGWFRHEEVRASHIAHVFARWGLDHACELAMALWSRAVADELAGIEASAASAHKQADSEIKAIAEKMPTQFLQRYFAEADIPTRLFTVSGGENTHSIPNAVVVEAIAGTKGEERKKIEATIRRIDFANGDINHFLEHLAEGLAHQYDHPDRSTE